MSNRPENVSLVRAVLTGVAEAIDLDRESLDDIRTAVTEACNNVVLHAYEGAEGPLALDVHVTAEQVSVVVRDVGCGIDGAEGWPEEIAVSPGGPAEGSLKLGLPMMRALAAGIELNQPAGGGTEVRMEFTTPGSRTLERGRGGEGLGPPIELPAPQRPELIAAATITIAPDRLARTVLPRLVGALAAHASFSTDRLSDAQLVADVIAAQAFRSISGSHLDVGIAVEPRLLELRVGPLPTGQKSETAADAVLGNLGPIVEKLIDDHTLAPLGGADVLALQLADRR
jgi:anti-sigma regulatory factor (Ser/Thr protein kinase)